MTLSVSIVAPASYTDPQVIGKAVTALGALGIEARLPRRLQAPHRYLAGSISHRLEGLYDAYHDNDTQAVWAVRGGYGCAQLVEHLDWSCLAPKPLIGYSDITVLLDQCHRHGLPAIHGPVMKEAALLQAEPLEQDAKSRDIIRAQFEALSALIQGDMPAPMSLIRYDSQDSAINAPVYEGPVVGGNLTTLACVAGTPAGFICPSGGLVILEDIGEPYYRLERALWQLLHSGALEHAGAICLGTFEGCTGASDSTLEAIFAEMLYPFGLPLVGGLPIGHGLYNRPWRYGAMGRIVENRLEFVDWEHHSQARRSST